MYWCPDTNIVPNSGVIDYIVFVTFFIDNPFLFVVFRLRIILCGGSRGVYRSI